MSSLKGPEAGEGKGNVKRDLPTKICSFTFVRRLVGLSGGSRLRLGGEMVNKKYKECAQVEVFANVCGRTANSVSEVFTPAETEFIEMAISANFLMRRIMKILT